MPKPIELPISAAWMYMSDDQQYNTIPQTWSKINFKNVDVLNVGPGGVQSNGTFGLFNSDETGDLANRFKWIIQTARNQNPNIKIIISQWWGDQGDHIWGKGLDSLDGDKAIPTYTSSVIEFLHSYLNVSGGVDGYDIDYESNNVVSNISKITSLIRLGMNGLSETFKRPFYLTVSPSTTTYLDKAVGSLNFVNMQTYAGGVYLTPQDFTKLGLKSQQLLYGICPETNCDSPEIPAVESAYTKNNLAGIHLWRLNSGDYIKEGQWQAQIYRFLHPQS